MTIPHRIVADVRDVKAIRLTCSCGASISFDPDKALLLPEKCHSCHEDWPRQGGYGNANIVITEFARLIKSARGLNEIVAIAMELELPTEKAETP